MTTFSSWRPLLRGLALALVCGGPGLAQADIVTLNGGTPLPNCPQPLFNYSCVVEGQAVVNGVTGAPIQQVRISRTAGYFNAAGLVVGNGASLNLVSNTVAADLVVGDNVGAAGALMVKDGGQVFIDAPNPNFGGLLIGAFSAPTDAPLNFFGQPQASTTVSILDGGAITVNKPAGPLVGSGVAVGRALGSNSLLYLDGGIGDFGNPALGATLTTPGNLSIGREGTGAVSLFRHATVNAGITYMSVISPTGQSTLGVGFQSTLNGSVIAGIGLNPLTGLADPNGSSHGTAVIHVQTQGFINGMVTMGKGATLYGTGMVGGISNFGGVVAPGNSPGILSIGDGGYTDVGGTLVIEFGLSGFDRLLVQGPVSLDGTHIDFRFIEGFAPDAGFEFDFLDSQDPFLSLQNLEYSITGLAPGFEFAVAQGSDGRLNFRALNAGVSTVPEAGSLALVAVGLLGVALARRR
jgi:hypothetical protein